MNTKSKVQFSIDAGYFTATKFRQAARMANLLDGHHMPIMVTVQNTETGATVVVTVQAGENHAQVLKRLVDAKRAVLA